MALENKYLNNKFLKTLEPLSKLSIDKLSEIVNKSSIEVYPAGRTLFRQGEKDKRSYYLVSGQLELFSSGDAKPDTIKAKTPEARYPVAQQIPRPSTAKAKINTEILSIDSSLLEMLLESDENPSGHYEVTEINSDDENGWMLKFLQSRAFLQIPTENIQKILMSMTELTTTKGETVVKQGEDNDFYYIVKSGKCSVSRRPSPAAEDVQIAILAAGDGFGEEALITEGHRNATVRMLEDGQLMRLSKDDFISLLVEPLLDYIHLDELKSRANAGDLLVDVRQHKDFMANHLDGAVNTPLSMIRLKLNTFNTERNTIVYCNDASRSTAAAFLLIQHGINCSILKNGLDGHSHTGKSSKSNTSMTDIIANLDSVTKQSTTTDATQNNVTPLPVNTNTKSKSNKIQKQIDDLNNSKSDLDKQKAAQAAEEKVEKLKAQEEKLKETKKKLQKEAELKQQVIDEKARLEQEKLRLEQEANALREKAEAEKVAAEEELKKLADEAKKHKLAVKAKLLAEQKAKALHEKAEAEKQQAEREAQLIREKAEAEKVAAERKAQAIREQAEAEKKVAELALVQQKQQAEEQLKLQQQINEASQRKVQQESEKIKAQANQELAKLREELHKTRSSVEERVKALKEKEKIQAEQEIRERQQHANDAIKESIEKARQQAAQDAEKVRQQALQEAQTLQKEIEIKKQKLETEAGRIRLEAERDRALTLELARKQAQEIVEKTTEEAEYLSQQRQELDNETETIRLQTEAERKATLEAAKQEAHDIVRKTAEEAQQLDIQRQRIESEVSKIITSAEQEKELTLEAAKKEAENIRITAEKNAQSQTKKEVEQVRSKTLHQAKLLQQQREAMEIRLKQAEEIRLQAEKEAERIRAEALQSSAQKTSIKDQQTGIEPQSNQQSSILSVEENTPKYQEINIPGTLNADSTQGQPALVESEAKSLAQEIVSKLEKAESQRIKEQQADKGNAGISLASASLQRRSDGRIVLEGEEDTFIFKEPKQYSDAELKELHVNLDDMQSNLGMPASQTLDSDEQKVQTELPDFTIEEPDFDLVDELPSHLMSKQSETDIGEFSDFELQHPNDLRINNKSVSKKPGQKIITIAASLFIAVGVGITFIGVNSEQAGLSNLTAEKQDSFNATRVSGIATNNIEIDKKVMSEAEQEFDKLLKKWKSSKDKLNAEKSPDDAAVQKP